MDTYFVYFPIVSFNDSTSHLRGEPFACHGTVPRLAPTPRCRPHGSRSQPSPPRTLVRSSRCSPTRRSAGGPARPRPPTSTGRIELQGEPALHGLFFNSHVSRRDHVAVYVVRQFSQDRLPKPNHEIIDCGFFAADALPDETTHGTRLRIAEVLDGKKRIGTWR